jgi:uncharacterized protein (TIGR03118 family)
MTQSHGVTGISSIPALAAGAVLAFGAMATSAQATNFNVVNLVSDGSITAAHTDSQLVDPWGLATSAGSPFWTANNAGGVATLYNTAGAKQGLVVTLAGVGGNPADPTGVVFNGTSSFVAPTSSPALFLFATETGTINAWSGGTTADIAVNNSGANAVYTGLAIGNNGVGDLLYAANFNSGQVEMYNSTFALVGTLQTDTALPSGYAAYNVQNLGGNLFVTYAKQDGARHDAVDGAGNGFVDEFSQSGAFERRIVSNGALDSPWGLALAPSSFGAFAGDLLVGNAGDGTISAYDLATTAFVGELRGVDGNPIVEGGLRALRVGNGGNGGLSDALYFTAGGPDAGLLGSISASAAAAAVPEPASWAIMILGLGGVGASLRRRRWTASQPA